MKNRNTITEGRILPALGVLFVPVMLGAFLQQCYNTIDVAIVGNFIGKQALAAVGGTSSTLINLLMEFFVGLSTGATVIIAQYFGAEKWNDLEKTIRAAIVLAVTSGIILMGIGLSLISVALKLVGAPPEIIPLAEQYLRIYFAGIVPMALYNIGAGILRAVGDTRTPLIFLILCCGINLILDILLVTVFHMGLRGVAFATVIAQSVSAICILVMLYFTKKPYCLKIPGVIPHGILGNMLKIGLPAGLQAMMYSFSNVLVQSKVNAFGTDTIAASSVYDRLEGFFWMFFNAYGIAVMTFMGQNYGAARKDRIRQGVRRAMGMGIALAVMLSIIVIVGGDFFFHIFTKDEHVISIGLTILYFLMPWYFVYVFIEVLSNTIRSFGIVFIPLLICGIGICGVRILWVEIIGWFCEDIKWVLFCYPVSWFVTAVTFMIYYFTLKKRYSV